MPTLRKCAALLLVACLACAALVLGGCRDTDALKEIIYSQTADIIDYDNPSKFYINDATADEESENVAALETSEDASARSDTVQNLVVYSSDPNTEGYTAKKSVFSPTPDFEGIEASEEVTFVLSDDPDAFDHAPTVDVPEDEPEPDQHQEATADPDASVNPDATVAVEGGASSGRASRGDGTGEGGGGDGDAPNPDDPGDKTPQGDEPEPVDQGEGGGNDDGDVPVAYDASDPTADPPQVESIAAFGQAAVLVQMIGGPGALAAADANTLDSSFAAAVDTSAIARGWSQDGSDAAMMDVDAVVSSGADAILAYKGDYLDAGLTPEGKSKLSKAGVQVVVIYAFTNSANIKQNASVVGSMLQGSSKAAYGGEAESRALSYRERHDRVVNACASANGGLAGSTMYQSGADQASRFTSKDSVYTLLLDDFDDTAAYKGTKLGDWTPQGGLAFASAGCSTTPVSYYIQAGGLVNSAAANTSRDAAGPVVAWQFQTNQFPFALKEWTGGDVTRSASMPAQDGDFCGSLLSTPYSLNMLGLGRSFGSPSMPKIIAKTTTIKNQVIANSGKESGVYHAYAFTNMGRYNMTGPNQYASSCIGYDSLAAAEENLFPKGKIPDGSIVVNPTGLFCDWTQGTVESFLEAAWVNDVVNDESSPVGWKNEVAGFYSWAYGYTLTSADWSKLNPEGR